MKIFERENISVTRPTFPISPQKIWEEQFTISPSKNREEQFTISPLQNEKYQFTISPSQDGKEQFTILPSKDGKEHFNISDPEPLTWPTEFSKENGKGHVPDNLDPDPSLLDSSSKKKKRNKKKNVVNTGNITRQTHHQAILIHPRVVIIDTPDVRGKAIGKSIR